MLVGAYVYMVGAYVYKHESLPQLMLLIGTVVRDWESSTRNVGGLALDLGCVHAIVTHTRLSSSRALRAECSWTLINPWLRSVFQLVNSSTT